MHQSHGLYEPYFYSYTAGWTDTQRDTTAEQQYMDHLDKTWGGKNAQHTTNQTSLT